MFFILRRAGVATFSAIIKIAIKLIKTVTEDLIKVKKIEKM